MTLLDPELVLDLYDELDAIERAYLVDHPPAISQYRVPRRAPVSGSMVVHTAESIADLDATDTGAEAVAAFIARRTTFGSYHILVDSDSTVLVCAYDWEAYGEGSGGNRWTIHLSCAAQAAKWATYPDDWVEDIILRLAVAAVHAAIWVYETTGTTVPAERITPSEYRARQPGFISHAELDPGRRSDPGAKFPWEKFLGYYAAVYLIVTGRKETVMPDPATTYTMAMQALHELYRSYREGPTSEREIDAWGRDLAEKIFTKGESPTATLQYIRHVLANEHAG